MESNLPRCVQSTTIALQKVSAEFGGLSFKALSEDTFSNLVTEQE